MKTIYPLVHLFTQRDSFELLVVTCPDVKVSRHTVQSRLARSSIQDKMSTDSMRITSFHCGRKSRPDVLMRMRAAAKTQAGQQHSHWIFLYESVHRAALRTTRKRPPRSPPLIIMWCCCVGREPNIDAFATFGLIYIDGCFHSNVWLITMNDGLYLGKLLFLGTYSLQKKQTCFSKALN